MAKLSKISIKSRWGLRRLLPRTEKLANVQWVHTREDFARERMAVKVSLSNRTAPLSAASFAMNGKNCSPAELNGKGAAFIPVYLSGKDASKVETLHFNLARLVYIDPKKGRAHFLSLFQPSKKWKALKNEEAMEGTGLARFTCTSGKNIYVNPWAIKKVKKDNPFRRAARWACQKMGMKTGPEIIKITLKNGKTFRVENAHMSLDFPFAPCYGADLIKFMKIKAKRQFSGYKKDFLESYRAQKEAIHRKAHPLRYFEFTPL